MKTLWKDLHAITMRDGRYNIIEDAAILTEDGLIIWIGKAHEVPDSDAQQISLNYWWVTPGLIDCHTHLVFAGSRSAEFEERLHGISYSEIAAKGGGIISTVNATRQATEQELLKLALKRIEFLMKDGVTAIEIKSGYGLDLNSERKILTVIQKLKTLLPITIKATCLAAHDIPIEYKNRSDEYIDYICDVMLPLFASENLIDAVDAFCEHIAFSPQQVEKVFRKAQKLNLPIKIHAEQLSSLHGSSLAAKYHGLSADHLEYMTEQDVIAMAQSDTVAVLLPGAFYMLREKQLPPIPSLRQHHVKIALSTDLNPGTSPMLSARLLLNMACTLFKMTPEEALAGVTINAAHALALNHQHGSLEQKKIANFVAWDITHPADLAYWLGGQIKNKIIVNGKILDVKEK
ncbi:imidazolonepropionase [Commensalibacter nepenthis]|uniref:Imidazolonepropionase n=1 Tax=Commensalibacter nepenthis TaxID=3043872 RepID=A0ABT6QAA0_9PROT|nr:imidazolonepropionase [Commensalibacter sp. TBRC 10068]MDI2113822.1 imidazolonepropionase [Commensalibacter sp. TBRC 10068]